MKIFTKIRICFIWVNTQKIQSEDVYEDFYKHKHWFYLSNYPKDSKFFDLVNENAIGKMKDVYKGKPIRKFVRIKPKMHCILLDDGEEFNTAKGVNIAMEFNEYKGILFNKKITRHKMRRIQSKKHMKSTKYRYHVSTINDLL